MRTVAHLMLGLALVSGTAAWGQEESVAPIDAPKIETAFDVAKGCGFNVHGWYLAFVASDKQYAPAKPNSLSELVSDDMLGSSGVTREQVVSIAKGLPGFAVDSPVWLARKPIVAPLVTARLGDSRCLFLTNVMTSAVLNTIQSSANERASLIASQIALRLILGVKKAMPPGSFACYGACVAYGSRDFSNRLEESDAESVTLVIPAGALDSLLSGEITDAEAIGLGTAYGNDHDRPESRKIKLEIK